MHVDGRRSAVLALHWQVNVVRPEGFFGGMLAEPVRRSGVVERACAFHTAARQRGLPLVFTRFTVPDGGGGLVENTGFMRAVSQSRDAFHPDGRGAALVDDVGFDPAVDEVADNQRLSGLAGGDLPDRLRSRGVDTLLVTGVATNLTVEQTARHGTDLGFRVVVVSDCVAAAGPAVHEMSLANLALVTEGCCSADEVLQALEVRTG
jgi:nicotinamidase-related amidase